MLFQVDVPFAVESITTDGTVFETLDFQPKTVVTIKLRNANSLLHSSDFTVTYRLPTLMMLMKPLFLSGVIFALLLTLIVSGRMGSDSASKQKKE